MTLRCEIPADVLAMIKEHTAKIDADIYIFNSEIVSKRDLELIEVVAANKSRPCALLVLVTNGGDPDCAYRMCRYFQEKYEHLTVLVPGRCKSAGTLIALGATEFAFTPYGELGPLDIQMSKVDKFDRAESGLVIQDALNTLEQRARSTYLEMVSEYMSANNGLLSFAAASRSVGEFVSQLYAPVFGRVDPEEVGAKTRSMRIAQDYGQRLAARWQNVKPNTIQVLAESYSSHSFVIDQREAAALFERVRMATADEAMLVALLGNYARFQIARDESLIYMLSTSKPAEEIPNDNDADGGGAQNGSDSEGSGETAQLGSGSALRFEPVPATAAE